MDFNNIILIFQQLSGCGVEKINDNLPLINNAVSQLKGVIDEENLTAISIRQCEYAAAVCALYDFICKESAREKIVVTAGGKASANTDYSSRIDGAEKLKINALSAIKYLLKDNDFLFMKM